MERVVNVRHGEPYDVYIGRANGRYGLSASKWANPFKLPPRPSQKQRLEAILAFEDYITRGEGSHLLEDLGELEGKTLGCWCAPMGGVTVRDELVCHGQVLLRLLEGKRES